MPATSVAQRKAMAIAEHHPNELYGRNKGLLQMSHQQLHDFAATPEKGLPNRVGTRSRRKGFAGPPKGRGFTTPPSMKLRRQMRSSAVCATCGGLHAEHRLNVPVSL